SAAAKLARSATAAEPPDRDPVPDLPSAHALTQRGDPPGHLVARGRRQRRRVRRRYRAQVSPAYAGGDDLNAHPPRLQRRRRDRWYFDTTAGLLHLHCSGLHTNRLTLDKFPCHGRAYVPARSPTRGPRRIGTNGMLMPPDPSHNGG